MNVHLVGLYLESSDYSLTGRLRLMMQCFILLICRVRGGLSWGWSSK